MLSVLDSDKRLADHFGGKVSVSPAFQTWSNLLMAIQLHLGYHELRQLLTKFAEERMTGRSFNAPPPAAAPHASNAPANAPAGPRPNPPLFAPSGPSGARRPEMGSSPVPQTPMDGPRVPPADEMPAVGHGQKIKREAGELVEDVKEERSRRDSDAGRYGEGPIP